MHSAFFFLQPLLHKQAGPLSEPCRRDTASPQATQNTCILLDFPPQEASGSKHACLRSWLVPCYSPYKYKPVLTGTDSRNCLSWLPVWWRRAPRQWGAMRHIQRQQTTETLREQQTVHVQARHSMQQYVPVGCGLCAVQAASSSRLVALRSSRTVPL